MGREVPMEEQRVLSYWEWIGAVKNNPFGAGKEAVLLALSTVVVLILAFVLGAKPFFAMLPSGRYPRILLALPFLLVAAVVFFALSPLFYGWYSSSRVRS
jgi:hypothetical protein